MGLALNTIFFYFLIAVLGDNDGRWSNWKVFATVLAGGMVQAICMIELKMGPLGTALSAAAVMLPLLVAWCRTSLGSAAKIGACFIAACVAYHFVVDTLSSQAVA